MLGDERIFSSLLDLFNVALAIFFLGRFLVLVSARSIRLCSFSFSNGCCKFCVSHFTFVSSPVSGKVNGIFLAHGFSSFGRCPFGCFCCVIPRTKSLESLNWFRPKWWLLELALSASSLSPLLPIFPFWCCSAFYLHCHFSVAQMGV